MSNNEFIGVDISKYKYDVAYIDSNHTTHYQTFPNNLSGHKEFFNWLTERCIDPWVTMEATGCYSFGLANFLISKNIKVSVENPLTIRHFANAKLSRNKNDRLDAKVIAQAAQALRPRIYVPKNKSLIELAELLQVLDVLIAEKVRLENKLEACCSTLARKQLKKCLDSLAKRHNDIEKTVLELVNSSEELTRKTHLLTSIKGIGWKTAVQLIAYLPDISQLKAKELAAYAGLSPRLNESGKFKGKTTLSKYGNPNLRRILYMPALSAKRHNEHLQAFIKRLETNGKSKKSIIGALMRKLLHIVYGILKSNMPFDPIKV